MRSTNHIQTNLHVFQQRLNDAGRIVASSSSVEIILRVAYKTIKFYSEIGNACGKAIFFGFHKLQSQLQDSAETLALFLTVHRIQEFACPDKTGHYFFRRFSWQKCTSRAFLLLYTILTDIKMAAKFGFIPQERINKIVFWQLSSLRLAINGAHILYHFFASWEGIRTKTCWKTAISAGKIMMTVIGIIIIAQNVSYVPFILTVKAISLGIDNLDAAKKLGIL